MNQKTRLRLLCCLALTVSALPASADHPSATFGAAQAGALITIPASKLDKGTWMAGFRTERIELSPLSDAILEQSALDGEAVHSVDSLVTHYAALAYGVSERLTLGLTIPYVSRDGVREGEIHTGIPEVHRHNTIEGTGDATLLSQYQLKPGDTGTLYSVLLGVQLPTGDDEATDSGSHIEAEFQPGSGEWHPMFGISTSRPLGGGSLDANLLYLYTREGSHHTRIGSLLNYNIAWSKRFNNEQPDDTNHDHDDHTHITWDAIVELNGEWRAKNEAHHVKEQHSGGNLIYLSPGLRVSIAERLNLHASVGIPVFDNHNGKQADVDYRTNIGLSMSL